MNKVLIIEDDVLVANIYRNRFKVEGYHVEIAADGEAGLGLVRSFRPDAVVLDLMLPKVTGVEVIKRVRAQPEFAKLPIIVLTNSHGSRMAQDAREAGATECLSKENSVPRKLVEIIRDALSGDGAAVSKPSAEAQAGNNGSLQVSPPAAAPAPESGSGQGATQAAILANLRDSLQGLIKNSNESERLKRLDVLQRHVHELVLRTDVSGSQQISRFANALEALVVELRGHPRKINVSTLRTVAGAIDCLAFLLDGAGQSQSQAAAPRILVVDDEPISRHAVTHALEKAGLKYVPVEDPNLAFELLSRHAFDLVFLDVDMPGMTGFELCVKLRGLPAHKKTPVVFVTALEDLESRATSTTSGGDDFIAKPFLFAELAVKALIRVAGRGQPTDSNSAA